MSAETMFNLIGLGSVTVTVLAVFIAWIVVMYRADRPVRLRRR